MVINQLLLHEKKESVFWIVYAHFTFIQDKEIFLSKFNYWQGK